MSKALTSKSIGQFLLDNAITIVLLLLVAVFVYNDPSFLSLVNFDQYFVAGFDQRDYCLGCGRSDRDAGYGLVRRPHGGFVRGCGGIIAAITG